MDALERLRKLPLKTIATCVLSGLLCGLSAVTCALGWYASVMFPGELSPVLVFSVVWFFMWAIPLVSVYLALFFDEEVSLTGVMSLCGAYVIVFFVYIRFMLGLKDGSNIIFSAATTPTCLVTFFGMVGLGALSTKESDASFERSYVGVGAVMFAAALCFAIGGLFVVRYVHHVTEDVIPAVEDTLPEVVKKHDEDEKDMAKVIAEATSDKERMAPERMEMEVFENARRADEVELLSVDEAYELLAERGFGGMSAFADYAKNGSYRESNSLVRGETYPEYTTIFSTDDAMWYIRVTDGTVTAEPYMISPEYRSKVEDSSALITLTLVEDDHIVQYDPVRNVFSDKSLNEHMTPVDVVDRIDADTLSEYGWEDIVKAYERGKGSSR